MKISKLLIACLAFCTLFTPLGVVRAEETKAPDMIIATELPSADKQGTTTFKTKEEMECYRERQAREAVKQGDAYLPKQTQIKLELMAPVSSNKSKTKDTIYLRVMNNILVNDVIIIPEDTAVRGVVLKAGGAGMFGKGGKLEVNIPTVTTANHVEVPLNGYVKGYGANMQDTAWEVERIVPFGGMMMRGENISYKQGQIFVVAVKKDTDLQNTPEGLKVILPSVKPQASVPLAKVAPQEKPIQQANAKQQVTITRQ